MKMKAQDLVAAIVRLFAFYLLLQLILALPWALVSLQQLRKEYSIVVYESFWGSSYLITVVFPLLLYGACALFLFIKSKAIARRVIADPDAEIPVLNADANTAIAWVLRFLGVICLIWWLPDIVKSICDVAVDATFAFDRVEFKNSFWRKDFPSFFSNAFGVVMGLALIFKAEKIVGWITPKPKTPTPNS